MCARMDPAELQRLIYQMRRNQQPFSLAEEEEHNQMECCDGEVYKFQVKIMNQRSNMMHYTSKVGKIVCEADSEDDADDSSEQAADDVQVAHLSQIPIIKVQKEGPAQYIQDDSICLELAVL